MPRELGSVDPTIDTSKPHPARMYDYLLGGKDHFAADRETAEKAIQAIPTGRTAARENRAFLGRAVRYLAAEAGIRQFLDIGTGLPSVGNVHEVAQAAAPQCRVVYVDNDPIVLAHARALLTGTPPGRTAYVEADLREPEKILTHQATRQTLDFGQPLALMLVGILHFVPDEADPAKIMATLLDALPPGSYLAASHGALEYNPEGAAAWTRTYQDSGVPFQLRTADEFADLAFRGLEMAEPGLVVVSEWRPDNDDPRPLPSEVGINGAVARKP
jgi:O-methyltransferase involved in polyketide biosynthesis